MARPSHIERVGESFEDVLAAAQTGADWAVAVLYRSLQPRLLRFLRARAPQDAEDIASQAWLEVARGLPRFSGDEDGSAPSCSPSPAAVSPTIAGPPAAGPWT